MRAYSGFPPAALRLAGLQELTPALSLEGRGRKPGNVMTYKRCHTVPSPLGGEG